MPICRNEQFVIKPGFYISAALFLLLLPLRWVISWFISAAVHEICHYIALKICKVNIFTINIGLSGAAMETEPMSKPVEIVCALAGPLGGLSLLVLSRWFPYIAICAFVQTSYNLLPLYPLDGGRALQCFTQHIFSEHKALYICRLIEYLLFATLFILAFIATFHLNLGPIPLIFVILIFLKNRKIKFPCKQSQQIVQ